MPLHDPAQLVRPFHETVLDGPRARLLGGSRDVARQPLRLPAAAAAAVAALAHLPVIPDHLSEAPYVGWLFIGLAALCLAGAVALLVDDSVPVWTGLGAVCAAAVGGYLLSRGPGLPAMSDDVGDWANPLGVISVLTEGLVAVLAGVALTRQARTARAAAAVPGPLRFAAASRALLAGRPLPVAVWVIAGAGVVLALGTYPLGWLSA